MNRLARPDAETRARWDAFPKMIAARTAVRAQVAAGERPIFAPIWSDPSFHKKTSLTDAFAAQQGMLCAWCTVDTARGGSAGDLDHIRPKAEVHRFAATSGSDELRRNRDRECIPEPPLSGYWWRAYDFDNFAFCCQFCNQKWKKNLYPVEPWDKAGQFVAPTANTLEQELLLDPFDPAFCPLNHFEFDEIGNIVPRNADRRAEATIETCGLFRDKLCEMRREIWSIAADHVDDFRRWRLDPSIRFEGARIRSRLSSRQPFASCYEFALKYALESYGFSWSELESAICEPGATENTSATRTGSIGI